MELILGAAVSVIMQGLKVKFKLGEYATLGVLLLMALAASAIYTTLVTVGLWETVGGVLLTAGAFYTFIIKRFTKGSAIASLAESQKVLQ